MEFPHAYEFAFEIVQLLENSYPYMGEKFTEKLTNDEDENLPLNIFELLDKIQKRLSQRKADLSGEGNKKRAFRSIGATLQGVSQDIDSGIPDAKRICIGKGNDKRNKENIKKCPCQFSGCKGWKQCWYFNPRAARRNWSPKPDIVEKIDNKRASDIDFDKRCKDWERRMNVVIGRKDHSGEIRSSGAATRDITRSQ